MPSAGSEIARPTDVIFLHGNGLEVSGVSLESEDERLFLADYEQVDPTGVARLTFSSPVPAQTLRELCAELHRVGEQAMGLSVDFEPLFERLCAYSLSIADYRGAVKEWPWRNGWFVDQGQRLAIATPVHTRLLSEVGR